MKVKLDLSYAKSDRQSFFTEGNIVMVLGKYKGDKFRAEKITHPPILGKMSK
jgi:hypothetical protein